MKKNMLISCALLVSLTFLFGSCSKEENNGVPLNLSGSVDIESYTVGNSSAVIDTANATITIRLPFGTDFSKVIPTIKVAKSATVVPASGTEVDLTQPVTYQVVNGNVYKNFTVKAEEIPAIQQFKVAGVEGTINEDNRTINILVPGGSDMSSLPVEIKLTEGVSISPKSGTNVDFTSPVTFTVTTPIVSVDYTVTAVDENAVKPIAFLGIYPSKSSITNPDEKAAAAWFFDRYAKGEYVSFDDIKNGSVDLSKYSVIWWHEDATQSLPGIATNQEIVDAVKSYNHAGGTLLLTTYAASWLEALGIVPAGKGPNNLFGDQVPNQKQNANNWGISFEGHKDHPLFQGLTLTSDFSYPTAYLLGKDAFRLNHTSWWQVNAWGGYGDIQGWRDQTGGIDLAGPEWSQDRNEHVSIAEFPKTDGSGNTIAITPGSYDWYAEPNPATGDPSPANVYLSNIKKLTENAIHYLRNN